MLKMAVRVTATMEAQFNSVERIFHYTTGVPTEDEDKDDKARAKQGLLIDASATLQTRDDDIEMNNRAAAALAPIIPPESWPQHGVVEFKNAVMRYRDGPPVLKGVSFKVNAHDHVGIAGRTGYVSHFKKLYLCLCFFICFLSPFPVFFFFEEIMLVVLILTFIFIYVLVFFCFAQVWKE
jgi:hypothetical protein